MREPARLLLKLAGFSSVSGDTAPGRTIAGWALPGLLVVTFGVLVALVSPSFGYDFDVADMPIVGVTVGLVAAGALYCLYLPGHISKWAHRGGPLRVAMACIIFAGLGARLALFASEPILEDDYQRYLWDGAVTASGQNPYRTAPVDARDAGSALNTLADGSGTVIDRVNHPELKTVYPPVAQLAFAIAHAIEPYSLAAWRSVLLAFDVTTFALILLLLREVGRSPLWSALYWWNPLVIKELFNSAHMDAVVLPFVLAALLLAIRKRTIAATLSLAVAVGVKLWPILLLPLILRDCAGRTRVLAAATLGFAGLSALWVLPILAGGLDPSSGFVAYASDWDTNSALFPALEGLAAPVLPLFALPAEAAGLLLRGMIAVGLGSLAIAVSLRPIANPDDLLGRASIVVAALVIFSPAQFPWYVAWFAPFLAFRPWLGFLVLTATAPLYYLGFYFFSEQRPEIVDNVVVWLVWVPVWVALAVDVLRGTSVGGREVPAHV